MHGITDRRRRTPILVVLASLLACGDACEPAARPPAAQPSRVARWLVATATWGVVSTSSVARGGSAWGNVLSLADNCTGVPLFYMSKLDETARDLAVEPRATLTVAEAALPGQCVVKDPEDPQCAKVSLHGRIVKSPDQKAAREALVRKHPSMRFWPPNHGFEAYVMEISDVFVLSDYGGAHPISVGEYLRSAPDQNPPE
ncbi:pyridoxamine 5'-phosphate oxidase-domain-containing protein [Pavlovales sp. CCMP2436]|nr:pyridoxamine 5'-phosphate oxidase-domain-containing protein [Pavlovales sp. CCMP2436]